MAIIESNQMSTEMPQTEIVESAPKIVESVSEIIQETTPEKPESDIDKLGTSIAKTKVEWHEFPHSIKVNIIGQDPYILSVGDFITYEGRQDTGVIIVKIYGYEEESGPRCMTYLPWRDEEARWATRLFSLKGDLRKIICYPEGMHHYGHHIDWSTIKNMNHMAPTSNPVFQNRLHSLRNPESEQ